MADACSLSATTASRTYASMVARTPWYSLRSCSGKKPAPWVYLMSRAPFRRKNIFSPWCGYVLSGSHIVGCGTMAVTGYHVFDTRPHCAASDPF